MQEKLENVTQKVRKLRPNNIIIPITWSMMKPLVISQLLMPNMGMLGSQGFNLELS